MKFIVFILLAILLIIPSLSDIAYERTFFDVFLQHFSPKTVNKFHNRADYSRGGKINFQGFLRGANTYTQVLKKIVPKLQGANLPANVGEILKKESLKIYNRRLNVMIVHAMGNEVFSQKQNFVTFKEVNNRIKYTHHNSNNNKLRLKNENQRTKKKEIN